MKSQKGVSRWGVILIIALLIAAGFFWSKYFARPTATVMTQGLDEAKPALEKAHRMSDTAERAVRAAEEATKKMNEETTKQQE